MAEDIIETREGPIDARNAVDKVKAFMDADGKSYEPPPIPDSLKELKVSAIEAVALIAEDVQLPGEVKKIFNRENPRDFPADAEHVRQMYFNAEKLKDIYVDKTTGLETTAVMRRKLLVDLRGHLTQVRDVIAESGSIDEAVAAVRGKLSDEYQDQLDKELRVAATATHEDIGDDPVKQAAAREKLTKHILERNFLLSHMSTIAVGSCDIQGMKTANTYFEMNPRKDMDPEDATNMLGIRRQGRTKQAVTKLSGNTEYNDSLASLDGQTEIVYFDETKVTQVSGESYEARAGALLGEENLKFLRDNNIQIIEYRRRVEAGDEGSVLVIKDQKTPDGRPIPINNKRHKEKNRTGEPDDVDVLENALARASYVQIGEYTKKQSNKIKSVIRSYFGWRSSIPEQQDTVEVYIQDRVSIVRMDEALKQSIQVTDAEYQEIMENPELLIEKAIDAAWAAAGNSMAEAKADEPKKYLRDAINGDRMAQLYVAQSHLNGRALANPDKLRPLVTGADYVDKRKLNQQEFDVVYAQVEQRTSKWDE